MRIKVTSVADIAKKVKMYCELYSINPSLISYVNISGNVNGKDLWINYLSQDYKTYETPFGETFPVKKMEGCTISIGVKEY